MKKTIRLAKHAGFCYGVKRAVETTKKIKAENQNTKVCILGELIHNSHVISELSELGIVTIDNLQNENNSICIIRSHGASPDVFREIEKRNLKLVDLTCPDVKKVQQKAIELVKDGYLLIIIGKAEHPEVVAIKANAEIYGNKIFVASSIDDIKKISTEINNTDKIGIVVQTTQRAEVLNKITEYLKTFNKDLKIENTICASTSLRQKSAKELAQISDLMVVVGGRNSANTTHLAEILTDITDTIHIEDEKELSKYENKILTADNIGVTAGASTPDEIINNVIKKLKTY